MRPIHCLEAILFARQHRRYSQLTQPTEFIASELRKRVDGRDLVRIYAGASNEMFPPKAFYGFDLVERDVAAGWQLDSVLHNHTVRRVGGRVLVANGVYTGEVPAEALPLFLTRD